MGFRPSSSKNRTPVAQARGKATTPNSPQYSLLQTIVLIAFAVVVVLTNTRFWWFIVEAMHFFWTPYTYASGRINHVSRTWLQNTLATILVAQKSLMLFIYPPYATAFWYIAKKSSKSVTSSLFSVRSLLSSVILSLFSGAIPLIAVRSLSRSSSIAVSLVFKNFRTRFWTFSYSGSYAKKYL